MKTIETNPFTEFDLPINRKAIFQPFSHEAKKFGIEKSIDLLTFIVLKGYNLHQIVFDYLESKVSLNDRSRISELESAFSFYHTKINKHYNVRNKYCSSSKLKSLTKSYAVQLLVFENTVLKDSGDLINFIERMIEQIEGFVNTVQKLGLPKSMSLRNLIMSFVDNDHATYNLLSKLWQVDLKKDLTEEINKREINNEFNPHWSQGSLYAIVESTFSSLKYNQISNYLSPVYDCPATQIINTFMKRYYPVEDHDRIKTDEVFRRERILDYTEKLVEILWLNKPYFDEPIYVARTNFPKSDIANQHVPELFERNLISICIKDHEAVEIQLYDDILNKRNVKFNRKLNYIHRFFDIVNLIKNEDVLVISSYLGGYDNKIGLIKKGSEIVKLKKDDLTFYCLQMKSVYCTPYPYFWGYRNEITTVNLSKYPILKSLIPQQVTLSPVQKNRNKIYSIYYGYPQKYELASISNENIETMCTEWLRSDYAPKDFKIQFQLQKSGGNFADIDIIGCNSKNEKIVCQVTNTENKNLIKVKVQKLYKFDSDKKIMFSHLKTLWDSPFSFNQNISEIWNDFEKDEVYKNLLEQLINR